MTGTLADIDVQALDVPGVTFQLGHVPEFARIRLTCSGDRGVTELWMTDLDALPESVRGIPSLRHAGGVEIHSPRPHGDPSDGGPVECDLAPGGQCYGGGVSLVGLPFPALVEARDSAEVLRLLAERHAAAFGGAR